MGWHRPSFGIGIRSWLWTSERLVRVLMYSWSPYHPQVSAARSFVFLWCGSSDGLDLGRLCLQNWGFRRWTCICNIAIAMEKYRCEDICWIRTNNKNSGTGILDPRAVLTRFYSLSCSWSSIKLGIMHFSRTKEHCLMGIKGTVRRSTDGDFIHANVDIDLIIDEEPVVSEIQFINFYSFKFF